MAEWPNARVCRTCVRKDYPGSNPGLGTRYHSVPGSHVPHGTVAQKERVRRRYMTEKVIGYILLGVGILIIAASFLSVLLVFTKTIEPVSIFETKGVSLDFGQFLTGSLPPEVQGTLTVEQKAQKSEIISADYLNTASNLAAHIFLAGFFAGIGHKLASIGTNLVRPIVIEAKEKPQS